MRKIPHTTSLLIGVLIAVALGTIKDAVFWEQDIPARLQCVVRTADGCTIWADGFRARRYLNAEAGK